MHQHHHQQKPLENIKQNSYSLSKCAGVEIHAQNSGIHSQKSDSNHYFHDFGVDSTIICEWIQL